MNPARGMRYALLTLVAVLAVQSAASACICCCCPRSPGYWMNHPEAWPVSSITIGGVPYTNIEDVITLMKLPVKGDASLILFPQLVAAELNVASGCCSDCIACTIWEADYWFCLYPVCSGVAPSSDAWQGDECCWLPGGEHLYQCLEAYNSGELWCAPACEDED